MSVPTLNFWGNIFFSKENRNAEAVREGEGEKVRGKCGQRLPSVCLLINKPAPMKAIKMSAGYLPLVLLFSFLWKWAESKIRPS